MRDMMRNLALLVTLTTVLLTLANCRAGGPLLGAVYTSDGDLRVEGDGPTQPAVVHYSLSRPASISAWLADERGARLPLRDGQARPAGEDYQLAFDGTYSPAPDSLERRVVPPGRYHVTVQAVDEQGLREEGTTDVTVLAADVDAPRIEELV